MPKPQPAEEAFWHAFGLEKVELPPECADDEELPTPEEVDLISTVVALCGTAPAVPSAQVWEEIQARVQSEQRAPFHAFPWRPVVTWGGWGVAASLAALLTWKGAHSPAPLDMAATAPAAPATGEVSASTPASSPTPPVPTPLSPATPHAVAAAPLPAPLPPPAFVETPSEVTLPSEKAEKHRLIQEIETLRAQLAQLQERSQERLAIIPGVSWPVVIEMRPPGVQMETEDVPITSRLGDALVSQAPSPGPALAAALTEAGPGTFTAPPPSAAPPTLAEADTAASSTNTTSRPRTTPSATPIYDPARDVGTLALHNFDELKRLHLALRPSGTMPAEAAPLTSLTSPGTAVSLMNTQTEPAAGTGTGTGPIYSLWVKAASTGEPILVGQIPNDLPANTSVDFSLGTTGIIPQGFYILGTFAEEPLRYDPQRVLLQGP